MRIKTTITLTAERLDRFDRNRPAPPERDRKDIEIINRNAKRLNREALDTLDYQQLP